MEGGGGSEKPSRSDSSKIDAAAGRKAQTLLNEGKKRFALVLLIAFFVSSLVVGHENGGNGCGVMGCVVLVMQLVMMASVRRLMRSLFGIYDENVWKWMCEMFR